MISVVDSLFSSAKTGLSRASFFIVLSMLVLAGCDAGPQKIQLSGATMGTSYHVTVASDQPAPADLADQVQGILDGIDQMMSTYRDDSELMQLNRQPLGEGMQVSEPLWEVLSLSSQVFVWSGGAFDPAVGRLVNLWGFGPARNGDVIPTNEAIDAALTDSGLQFVEFGNNRRVTRHRNVSIDLSAVAKGYAVDQVADYLESVALTDYLVEVGGEMRVSGNNAQGGLWRVAIESPDMTGEVERVVELAGGAVATSGDYRNYFELLGKRYSHTIDPRTGRPVTHNLASVTVLAERCAAADAMATAFSVLGAEQALEIANKGDIPIYVIVRESGTFKAKFSDAFAALAGQ